MHQKIKDYRVFSIAMTLYITILLTEALQWIYAMDYSTMTLDTAALPTAVLTALVALVKFSYTFAMGDTTKTD